MATDNGRINVAHVGVAAVEFDGPEKVAALRALDALELAVTEARVRERQATYVDGSYRPKRLKSVEDYENAPIGTVVAHGPLEVTFVRNWNGWQSSRDALLPVDVMARLHCDVIRWGDA